MPSSRREFIKVVVAGSVAAGCPLDETLIAAPESNLAVPLVHGEHFEVCHQPHVHGCARPVHEKSHHCCASMDRIFFGSSDSGGPESLTSEAVRLSKVGEEWAELILAGKPGAREIVEKALQPLLG